MTRQGPGEPHQAPVFFHDLNLDQIVEAIIAGWKEYDLAPFFYSQLNNLDAIAYRQEVMQDLEDKILMQSIKSFSGQMRAMREHLDQVKKIYYKRAMDRLFVGTVEIYCTAFLAGSRGARPKVARTACIPKVSEGVCRIGSLSKSLQMA
jgi:hypothetical protein